MRALYYRQLVGLFGFALAAVWIGLGTLATLLCLLSGAGFYLVTARLQERQRDQRADEFFERTNRPRRNVNSDAAARLPRASSA
jgi:hypothetical protein